MARRKITTEDFIERARRAHGDRYSYTKSVYKGANELITITCPHHGDFTQRANDHANVGKGCKECGTIRGAPTNLGKEGFIARARDIHGDRYDYSQVVYRSTKKKVCILCPTHGPFEQEAGKHLRGSGCPACSDGRKLRGAPLASREDRLRGWVAKATEVHGGFYDYSRVVYESSKRKVEILCPRHGSFWQSPDNHVNNRCGCPLCAIDRRGSAHRRDSDSWVRKFREVHGSVYDYSNVGEVRHGSERVQIICDEHGAFEQEVYVHAQGHKCPRCARQESSTESDLFTYVSSLCPDLEVRKRARDVIAPLELDVFVPEKRVAFEFNGTYWHSDAILKDRGYHQKKSLACAAAGVLLVHVYEYDWVSRREACESLIRGKLGSFDRKVGARSLELRPLRGHRQFFEKNHFQGWVAFESGFGLFEGDELLQVMTFGRPRFSRNHDWELLRLCSAEGALVQGGASRLFSAFKRDVLEDGDTVVSYARLDYSQGEVYSTLGFEREAVCRPDYVWVKQPGTVVSRYAAQKHKLGGLLGEKFDPGQSESENMKRAGFKRVYTAGNLRYVYAS